MAGMKNLPVYSLAAGKTPRRAVKATVYPKAGGTPYTGYVIEGRTYKDPEGKARIDEGSRVELNDGRTYIYNRESGGVPNYATAMQSYENSLKSGLDAYRESGKNIDNSINAGVKMTTQKLRADRDRVNAQAQEEKIGLERAYRQAANPHGVTAQRLEAIGLGDSGYAESTYAKLGGDYQQALGNVNAAKIQALGEIDAAITRAYQEGEIEKAKAWLELERDIMKYSSEGSENLADMRFKAASAAADDERWQQEDAYNRERDAIKDSQQAKDDKYNRALDLVKLGVSDDEIAAALGITRAQANGIAYRAVAKKTSSSKSTKDDKKELTPEEEKAEEQRRADRRRKLKGFIDVIITQSGVSDPDARQKMYDDYVLEAVARGYITFDDVKLMY